MSSWRDETLASERCVERSTKSKRISTTNFCSFFSFFFFSIHITSPSRRSLNESSQSGERYYCISRDTDGEGGGREGGEGVIEVSIFSSPQLGYAKNPWILVFLFSAIYNITLGSFVRSTYLITQSYKLESEVRLNNWQCEDAAVISVKREKELYERVFIFK